MEMAYGPVFTKVAVRGGKQGFRVLGMLEIIREAMGLRFPVEVKEGDTNFYTDLAALRASLYVKSRPIAVFPEGAKTNGKGILQIHPDIIEILAKAAKAGVKLHTLRFDFEFDYASPYNTTDLGGWRHLAKMLTQVRNVMLVQYYFNAEDKLLGTPADTH